MATPEESMQNVIESLQKGNMSISQFSKELAKLGLMVQSTEKQYQKTIDSMNSLQAEIDGLDETIKKTSDEAEKLVLINQKTAKEAAKNAAYDDAKRSARQKTMMEMSLEATKGIITSFTKAASSALQGGKGLEVAAGFMESGVDLANNVTQTASKGAQQFGESLMAGTGKTKLLGTAIAVGAQAIGFLSGQISDLAKQGIGFMMKQTNLMIDSFKAMSSVGAIYVGGMHEMLDVSRSAGMTIDQFTKAVSENKDAFAKSGLTVGEGSKRMAAAMKAGADSARNGMFALGMTIEEQADATAKTMALMAGPTGQLTASNEEVSKQTEEYAKNLRIISDITGEDAKTQQEKVRQANDSLFMDQQLAKMSEEQRIQFQQMQQTMNADDLRALNEKMKYGSIISTDLAATAALSPALAAKWDALYQATVDGSASAKKGSEIQAKTADSLRREALSQTSLAIVTSGTGVEMSKVLHEQLGHINKFNEKGVQAAEDAANTTITNAKEGKNATVDLMAANQNFALGMQEIAAKNLPEFGKALTTTIEMVGKAVQGIAGGAAGIGSAAIGTGVGAVLGGVLGSLSPVPGGAMMGAQLGGMLGGAVSGMFANGGIASGPDSGHTATLHGTELIVPFKGNKLDTTSDGYKDLLNAVAATSSKSTSAISPAAPSPSASSTQTNLGETNDHLSNQSSILKRILDINERQLGILEKTMHSVS